MVFVVGAALVLGGCSQSGDEALDSFSDMVGFMGEDHSPYTSDVDPLWSDFNLVEPEPLPREVVNPYIDGGDSAGRMPTVVEDENNVVLPADSDVVIVALCNQSEKLLLSYKNFTKELSVGAEVSSDSLVWSENHFATRTWDDFRKANEIINQNLARPAESGIATVLQQYVLEYCNLVDGEGNSVSGFDFQQVQNNLSHNLNCTQYVGRTAVGDLVALKTALEQKGKTTEIIVPNAGEDIFTFYKRVIDGKDGNTVYLCVGGAVDSGISCPGQESYLGMSGDGILDRCRSLADHIHEKCGGAAGYSTTSFLGIADGIVVVGIAPEMLEGSENAVADGVAAWFDSLE